MMRPGLPMPAQFTAMPHKPWASLAVCMACSALSALVTSQKTAIPPMSLATASALSICTSNTATLAPWLAKNLAVASPKPEAPPVTTAGTP